MGFSVTLSLLLVAPPYVLAIVISLATSWWSDKIHHRTPFILVHSTIAILGFALVAASSLPVGVRLAGTFLATAGAVPNQPTVLAFAQNNITGTSKRAVLSAVQVAFGAIGGIAASTVYREQDAPKYLPGYALAWTRLMVVWVQRWGLKDFHVCLLCQWHSTSIGRISRQIERILSLKDTKGSDIPHKVS
jgi:MFS family permease